ncbi:hypothetical protein [Mesorhizobium sp.]|uniref:hypothetical protein n=1 Tax=Mesorhizobium sp. TaxID=1871066 RepID=UPI000FE909D8|nr:hypothetical protein [Mesorhizobium sp.]RWC31567.1 MAG: hypothetical protein EOS27_10385 [Mesorhizobium sp.]TIX27826.1 MAG: hypothetical protein E5V35_04795 [Mesorhizobium sp.]
MSDPVLPYSTAKGYVQSAFLLMTNEIRFQAPDDSSFYLSFHMLLGFAMELYLKSFLLQNGYEEKALRAAGVRHDLSKLLEMAEAKGLKERGAVTLVDLLSEHHRSFGFRYTKAESEYPIINLQRVFEAFSSLDLAVDTVIGASVAHGKRPRGSWDFPNDFRKIWRFS